MWSLNAHATGKRKFFYHLYCIWPLVNETLVNKQRRQKTASSKDGVVKKLRRQKTASSPKETAS